jgi:hypothetical protein
MSTSTVTAEETLSAAIRKDLSVDDKGNVKGPDDIYARHLPEGLTMEMVDRASEHRKRFGVAAYEAFAEVSEDALKQHKDLDRTSMRLTTNGDDLLSAQYQRSVKRAVKGEKGKVTSETIYGVLSHKYTVQAGFSEDYSSIEERYAKQGKKLFTS